jgi:hypothetical protein
MIKAGAFDRKPGAVTNKEQDHKTRQIPATDELGQTYRTHCGCPRIIMPAKNH